MTWWHYLLLVNIYLTLFFGFYALLLRRETFFQMNRIYLVSASVLSFIIPLIQAQWVKDLFITRQVQSTIYSTGSAEVIVSFAPIKDNPVTIGELLTLFYAGGALFLAIRLVWQLFQVKQLMAKPSKEAYSFFNAIKLGEDNPDQDIIIKHEEVHAKQWHSADVLIIETVMIINWFNPVVYMYRFAIKHIHEFIADRQALEAGTNKADYALLLLSQTFNAPAHQLVNPFFNHSLLKQRIMMLHKDRSQRIKLAKYGLSAPLFVLMLVLSSATVNNSKAITTIDKHVNRVFNKSAVSVIPNADSLKITRKTIEIVKPDGSKADMKSYVLPAEVSEISPADTVPGKNEIFTEVEKSPSFPGGDKAFGQFLGKNVKYPKAAREKNVQGRVIASFIVEPDGKLTNIKIVRGIGSGADEETVRVLKLSPKWQPGIQNGRKVRVQYAVPVQFALAVETDITYTPSKTGAKVPAATAADIEQNKSQVFTAVEQSPGFPGGTKAFAQYLAKAIRYPEAARKNKTQGRVIVTFVIETDGSITQIRTVRGIGDGADEEAERVIRESPKWIAGTQNGHKVRVQYTVPIQFKLDGKAAGDNKTGKAQTGNGGFYNYTATVNPDVRNLLDTTSTKKTIVMRNPTGALAPLYLVNGKEVFDLESINPKDIKSINVIKDKSAILKYGAKGVNGVVAVEMKPVKVK